MAGLGVAEDGGALLEGWAHVVQSILTILTTPLGSRVMRRDFGSEVASLVDAPMTSRVLLALYAAAAIALARWEPRFKLTRVQLQLAGAKGAVGLRLSGTYYPRGHLGDFTVANTDMVADIALPLLGS